MGRRDDAVYRADLDGPFHGVDAVELIGNVTEFLGMDLAAEPVHPGSEPGLLGAFGLGEAGAQLDDPLIPVDATLHLASEDRRRGQRPSDDGGVGALERRGRSAQGVSPPWGKPGITSTVVELPDESVQVTVSRKSCP